VWLFRLLFWWFSRQQRLCEALLKTSVRRSDEAQLKSLEAEGFDVPSARALLATLDAEDAPTALAPPSSPPVAPPPALPTPPPVKRPPGRPRKAAAPGASFPNGSQR
jgi:hypothetical protein